MWISFPVRSVIGSRVFRYKTHHFEVRAGMLRRLSFSPTTQLRRVKNVMIHSDYRRLDMQNDVALVMLDEPLLFNRWVRQVCLPAADIAGAQWQQSPTSQSTCIAIGWGATREHGPDRKINSQFDDKNER